MNLGLCIANLLRQYPEVVVPGIGVFRKTPVAASFDVHGRVFLPPSSRINLIEGQAGGVLLTDYVKAQKQVDEETAASMLNDAVQELLATVHRSGKVLLSGLGYLVADGASLVFEQLSNAGLGLGPVRARDLIPTPAMPGPQPGEAAGTDPAPIEAAAAADEGMDVADEGMDVAGETGEYTGKRRTIWWMAAALVLALLTAGGIWFYQPAWLSEMRPASLTDGTKGKSRAPAADQAAEAQPEMGGTDSLGQEAIAGTTDAKDTVQAAAATETVPAEAAKPSVTYEIIVGSFETMKQAEKYVARMKTRGYDLKAIDSRMPGNRKKVSYGSFATEEEAYRELVHVQKNFQPDAWIAKVIHD